MKRMMTEDYDPDASMFGEATLTSTFEPGRHATRAVRALVILNMQVRRGGRNTVRAVML